MAAYTDLIMVLGIVLLLLAFPALVNAFSRGKSFRGVMFMLVLGGGMVAYANSSRPGGYSMGELPDLFLTVLTGG